MEIAMIRTSKGDISYCRFNDKTIDTASDMLELISSCQADTIAIDKDRLSGDFFDLKTGKAGEIIQKIITYSKRLIIIGDFRVAESKSLNDFIYESNKTGKIIFSENIDKAVTFLR